MAATKAAKAAAAPSKKAAPAKKAAAADVIKLPEMKMPKGVEVTLKKFTPKQAEAALSRNEVNRPLRGGSVDKYQADMENGFWNLAEAFIGFDDRGRLINGQHRLTAQVRSGATIWWVVATGLPEEYQETMDFGAVRKPADVLHMMGLSDSNMLAAVASICVKLERQNFSTTKNLVTTSEIVDIVHRHELLIHSAEEARRFVGGMTPVYPRVIGAAHWWISQFNEVAEADAFMARLATLSDQQKGSPILALARRTNEIKRLGQRVHWRDMFYMVIKAWNYDVEGVKVNKINTYAKSGGYQILEPEFREVPTVDTDEDLLEDDGTDEEVMEEQDKAS